MIVFSCYLVKLTGGPRTEIVLGCKPKAKTILSLNRWGAEGVPRGGGCLGGPPRVMLGPRRPNPTTYLSGLSATASFQKLNLENEKWALPLRYLNFQRAWVIDNKQCFWDLRPSNWKLANCNHENWPSCCVVYPRYKLFYHNGIHVYLI